MKQEHDFDMEVVVSWTLKIGVYLAAFVVVVGLIMFFVKGYSGYNPGQFPVTWPQIFQGVALGKPSAVVGLGLLILILTPVFRVAMSVFLFFLEKDYLYTWITIFVLAILLFGLFFGSAV